MLGMTVVAGIAILVVRRSFSLMPTSHIRTHTAVTGNLKLITVAMYNYSDVHRSLPPPAIYSKDGKPLLSWRVAILPYIEEERLYKQFRLDEPWDSSNNFALLKEMPDLFNDYPQTPRQPYTTTFRVFVGPGAAFEGPCGISLKDFPDGTSKTLLIVEAAEAVLWTKPAELAYGPESALPPLGGRFPNFVMVGLADASIMTLDRKTSEERVRAAITRNGGEQVKGLGE
jgi:hypothetical protein